MASRDRQLTQDVLIAQGASKNSDWIELTGFNPNSYTAGITLTVSAATLQGTLKVHGTNNFPQLPVATEPLLVSGVLLTPVDATMAHAAGVITVNNPGIGTHEIIMAWPQLPQWVLWEWTFTGGGGTVALAVRTAGW
jgi:hypothetical protein